MKYTLLLSAVLALGLTACGSEEDENDKPLTSSQPFTATADCPTGGIDVSVGNDSNENGVLDTGEVTSTERLCGDQFDASSFYKCGDTTCKIFGRIKQDFTLTADKTWIMIEDVVVGEGDRFLVSQNQVVDIKANGVTLTIEPGTEIQAFRNTSLAITRGSRIMATGTRDKPIIFKPYIKGSNWSGIHLYGFAPVYLEDVLDYNRETQSYDLIQENGTCGSESTPCNMRGADNIYYGGNQINDSSGILKYVQMNNNPVHPYDPHIFSALQLSGVGSKTQISNLGIINFKTGISITGGATNIEKIIHTSQENDNTYTFDISKGFKGNIKNVLSYSPINNQSYSHFGHLNITATNNDTEVNISNILLSTHTNNASIKSKRNAKIRIYNSAFYTNPKDNCLSNSIEYSSLLSGCMDSDLREKVIGNFPHLTETGALDSPLTFQATEPVPVDNGSNFSFEPSNYIGIMPPNSTLDDTWWHGWSKELDEIISLKTSNLERKRLGMPDFIRCSKEMSVCSLVSDIDRDFTIESSYSVSLLKDIKVGNNNQKSDFIDKPVTLTVEAGSEINQYYNLTITRNAKIIAQGTPEKPIEFGRTKLIILGKAPVHNSDHCNPESKACSIDLEYISTPSLYEHDPTQDQGNIIQYGGTSPEDSSGIVSHVKFLRYENEIYYSKMPYKHRFSLMGVGYGTQVNNIEVYGSNQHKNFSGIRITGGTVNIRNIVDSNSGGLTFSNGYKGNIQNLISLYAQPPRYSSYPARHSFIHIEDPSDEGSTPTQVAISNYLAISTYEGSQRQKQTSSVVTENYSDLRLYNSVLSDKHADAACIEVPSPSDETSLNITLANLMDDCRVGLFAEGRTANSQTGVTDLSAEGLALSINAAGVVTNSDITAIDLVEIDNGSSFEFENTDYMGAVKPGTTLEDAWWYGWTEPEFAEAMSSL